MRKLGVGVAVFLCVLFSSVYFFAATRNAAKVNGVALKSVTLDAAVNNFVENQKLLGIDVTEGDKEKLRGDILQELVSAELLYQESKKADLGDLSEEVKVQIENIKEGFGSEDEFRELLKDRGISEKDLNEDIKKGVYITKFLDKNVYVDLVITEEDKKAEYEKNKDRLQVPDTLRTSHILIKVEEGAKDEDKQIAKEKIEGLRKRALGGEDFAALAKEHSECASAANGGDLGYFKRGDMVKPFEDVAFTLEVGQISEVVETQFGYHIIKLVDKELAHTLTYEEVEGDITVFLVNEKRREKLEEFVEELRKNAEIEIY